MVSIPWYRISRRRLDVERSVLRSLPYFSMEREFFDSSRRLLVIGTLTYSRRRSGKIEHLRIRLEYPFDFPKRAQLVYDHNEVFRAGKDGHLPDHRLCLTLPERREFSTNTDKLTEEVLGAALVWFDKRLIYERNGGKWPGLDERHGAFAKVDLFIERAGLAQNQRALNWVGGALKSATTNGKDFEVDVYAPCPCGSGDKMKFCHFQGLRPLIKLLQELSVSAN